MAYIKESELSKGAGLRRGLPSSEFGSLVLIRPGAF